MPNASMLIQRGVNGSQLSSGNQVWVISARDGTTFQIRFDKEFVKKHLFVDPDPPADAGVKAASIVGKINRYGNLQGAAALGVPVNADAPTLRYLKLKKLVLSRTAQGTCSVCHKAETQHDQVCMNCNHKHKKPWAGGGPCKSDADAGCTCATWNARRAGHAGCPGFTVNDYQLDRQAHGKANPFGGSGGACTGTNTVVLMDAIDLQDFKDAVVDAIKVEDAKGWAVNQKKEGDGLALDFGAGSVATIKGTDSLADFNARARAKGIKVYAKRGTDSAHRVYCIYHFHEEIP